MLCAKHAYLATHGEPTSLSDLSNHRLLATDSQLPWYLDGPNGALILLGSSYVRTNSSKVARELVACGSGIALRSLWDVADALADGILERVLVNYQGTQTAGIFAVHAPQAPLSAKLTALIEHLKAELGKRLDALD